MSKIGNNFQLKNSFFTSPLEGKQLFVFCIGKWKIPHTWKISLDLHVDQVTWRFLTGTRCFLKSCHRLITPNSKCLRNKSHLNTLKLSVNCSHRSTCGRVRTDKVDPLLDLRFTKATQVKSKMEECRWHRWF